eukprot:scaffold5175_cov77-Skeletonema_marinoi.AAC.3
MMNNIITTQAPRPPHPIIHQSPAERLKAVHMLPWKMHLKAALQHQCTTPRLEKELPMLRNCNP